MKALTAFRNVLKRRGEILKTTVKCLLETDNVISFKVSFHFKPRKSKDMDTYDTFVRARAAARKSPDFLEET